MADPRPVLEGLSSMATRQVLMALVPVLLVAGALTWWLTLRSRPSSQH